MDIKKLDKFSRLMYELFSTSYPQWIQFAKNIPGHEETLVIEVPAPLDSQRKLRIYTNNKEITLGLDYARSHFGGDDIPDVSVFAEARERINEILNEEWLVASEIKDGKLKGSAFFVTSMLDEIIRNHPEYNRIVGWNYTYITEENPL
jgi:hypothetical protein